MTMSLKSLGDLEAALLARLGEFTGTIDEKVSHLEKSDIPGRYAEIYDSYIELFHSQNDRIEAVKRALFLCWYEQTEPSIYSGLSGVAEKRSTVNIFESLDSHLVSAEPDPELQWMVHYYYSVGEWVFEPYLHFGNLRSFLRTAHPEKVVPENVKVEEFEGRGQMGRYWSSMITSAAERTEFQRRIDANRIRKMNGPL